MHTNEARILVIDDHPVIHDIFALVAESIGSTIVGSARTLEEANNAIDNLGSTAVNIVLMYCNLAEDGKEGYGLTRRILAEHPKVHVFSISSDPTMAKDLGISSLGTSPDEIRTTIESL